jgi:hypothetical protein
MKRPLALTAVQLAQLKQAAAALPTLWRDAFLQAVARRLGGIANPTNGDVSTATIAVLGGLGIDPPTSAFLCEGDTS